MNKQQKEDFKKDIKDAGGKDMLGIYASSKMSLFCRESAYEIANFYNEDFYPLTTNELKPFLKQITKEFKKIFKAKE